MTLRWYTVVVDCHDISAQASWWAEVLGWKKIYEAEDEVVIIPPRLATNRPAPRRGIRCRRASCSSSCPRARP